MEPIYNFLSLYFPKYFSNDYLCKCRFRSRTEFKMEENNIKINDLGGVSLHF